MKNTLILLVVLISIIGCTNTPKEFNYTITGRVIGQDTGSIIFDVSPRIGDEIEIPFENGVFEYKGTASERIITSLVFLEDRMTGSWRPFPIIIEPGILEFELNRDSTYKNSTVIKGTDNLKLNIAHKAILRYFNAIYCDENSQSLRDSLTKNVYSDSLFQLIEQNADNFVSVFLINRFRDTKFLSMKQMDTITTFIKNPNLRNSFYFKRANSHFIAAKENYNKIGSKAVDFKIKDSTGSLIDFNSIAKNKTVFVEESGSWCYNQTVESRKLKPIYDRYKKYGLEIVTVISESDLERWKSWVAREKFPWTNLVEIDFDKSVKVTYSTQLFLEGDYLVNDSGFVVANNLTPEKLNELLMQQFEPNKYTEYLEEKWNLPENMLILDEDNSINSFDELTSRFAGKAFMIDCYATWCSPCIDEFQYSAELKTYLKKHDIELLYISFDDRLGDAKWLTFIKEHNLTGYNMRTNSDFQDDFMRRANFYGELPTYMLVDKDGTIVENNALKPSSGEELLNEIKSKLVK